MGNAAETVTPGELSFRQFFDQAGDAVYLHDMDEQLVEVNERAHTTLGYERDELLRLRLADIVAAPIPVETRAAWHTLAPGSVLTIESLLRHKDGSLIPVEVRISAFPTPAGRRVLGLVRDVTQRKEQEALVQDQTRRQQALSRLSMQALWEEEEAGEFVLDELFAEALTLVCATLQLDLGNVLECLPGNGMFLWRATHGWSLSRVGTIVAFAADRQSSSGYLLSTRQPLVVEDHARETRFQVATILHEEGMASGLSVIIHCGSGVPFGTLSVHGRKAQQFTPDQVSFVQAMANILGAAAARQAARKRLEQALAQAAADRQAAEQADEAKSGFLSRMSHELRTPLNAVLGFAQLLELSCLASEDQQCVSHIVTAGRHLLGLIDEVLDITRAETGELHLTLEEVNVAELTQECLALIAPMAAAKGIRCEVQASLQGLTLATDKQRLRQILLNLLSNAVKYNCDRGEVRVEAEIIEQSTLRIRVADTGPGIASEALARLFVPFERLGQEQSGEKGTGLGLVISRRLAEAMGGHLEVQSEVGRGSTFALELPLIGAGDLRTKTGLADLVEPPAEPPAASPGSTLLYVEDNESNRQLLQTLLAKCRPHWKLLSATDGQEGLSLARQHVPDLVLLDLQLPDLPGNQVLEELRRDARTSRLPILMLTANALPQERERLLKLGADGYIAKPFNLPNLLAQIDQVLYKPLLENVTEPPLVS